IVAGLISTFERKPFLPMINLLAYAEKIVKLKSVCQTCKSENACFTMRHAAANLSTHPTELVGGAESYAAVCRKCHPCS
ncbi:MAG: hypothetical protein WBV73_02775, partial [Phormidium sp.]